MNEKIEKTGIDDPFATGLKDGLNGIVSFYQRIAGLSPEAVTTEKVGFKRGLTLHLAKVLGGLPVGEHGETEDFDTAQQAALKAWGTAANLTLIALDTGLGASQAMLETGRLHKIRMEKSRKIIGDKF